MINRTFKSLVLGVLFCSSLSTPAQAQVNTETVVVALSGAVSGLALTKIFHKVRANYSKEAAALAVLCTIPAASYIRTRLVPAATQQDDALGLLAAIGTFWYAV